MTPQTCKKLLEMGILQAYAEGKKIEVYTEYGWYPLTKNPLWVNKPENYRIKPEPQFEVGDLVRVPSDCICKVIQVHPDACEVQSIIGHYYNIVHNSSLTKVHEVRTPFTFEQAIKACAEHGFKVRYGTLESSITELDHDSIRIDDQYLYYNKECFETVFTSNNTPFCNISYEPTTTR